MKLSKCERAVDRLVKARRKMGRKTYGQALRHGDKRYSWETMALEEALDLAQYLMALVLRLKDRIRQLEKAKKGELGK